MIETETFYVFINITFLAVELHSNFLCDTLEVEDEAPLAAFLREVPNAMIMMEGIMSFLIGPMDPRFL